MNPYVARLREKVEALGTAGVVGVALLVFAATLYATAVAPLAQERARLQAEAEPHAATPEDERFPPWRAEARSPNSSRRSTRSSRRRRARPTGSARSTRRRKPRASCSQSGEYKLERSPDSRLARYQITLPVTGSYAQLRGFVGQVLADVPAAALEEITLRRESVSSPRLDARIRLTLYLGSA